MSTRLGTEVLLTRGAARFEAVSPLEVLTLRERRILGEVLDGASSKCIALTFGVSETRISKALANSASKLGLRDRAALVHYAASLAGACGRRFPAGLTSAERDVLALIVAGHSNQQIAALRGRSHRTVANQVSALLRKTGLGNRRSLMVTFCKAAHEN